MKPFLITNASHRAAAAPHTGKIFHKIILLGSITKSKLKPKYFIPINRKIIDFQKSKLNPVEFLHIEIERFYSLTIVLFRLHKSEFNLSGIFFKPLCS